MSQHLSSTATAVAVFFKVVNEKPAAVEFPTSLARGFILVGGHSSRFGADKALHRVAGRPMALRVADVVSRVAASVTLVGRPEKYRQLGLPVMADKLDGIGPLGGILSVLEESDTEWNLIVACDLPRIRQGVLELLMEQTRRSAADVVWPVTPDGRLQPLCAAYSKRSVRRVRPAVERGVRKITEAFAECRIAKLPFEDRAPFSNVNHKSELESLFQDPAL